MSEECKCFEPYLHSASGVTKKMLMKSCGKCAEKCLVHFPYYFKKESVGDEGQDIEIYGVMYNETDGLFIIKKTYLFIDLSYEIGKNMFLGDVLNSNEKSYCAEFNKVRNEMIEFIRQ